MRGGRRMNLATKITLSRILALPIIVVLFYVPFAYHRLVAAVVFVLAAITDMIDGKVARKRGEVTSLGKLLDPIADKVLACSLLILEAASGLMMYDPAGIILTAIIVAREIGIGAFRTLAAHKGEILAADKFGKLKTIFTNVAIPVIMIGELHDSIRIAGSAIFALAALFTVISGVNYIVKNRQVLAEGGENGD